MAHLSPPPNQVAARRGAAEDDASWSQWLAIFGSLTLSGLRGFPHFEEDLFFALHAHWKDLLSIFLQARLTPNLNPNPNPLTLLSIFLQARLSPNPNPTP